MKRQLFIALFALSLTMPWVSYFFNLPDMETMVSAAAPVVVVSHKPSLDIQALTSAEVEAREFKPLGQPLTTYVNEAYQLNYPTEWQVVTLSAQQVKFQSPDGRAQVIVQAMTPLANDNLAAFVSRLTAHQVGVTRQALQINGFSAERVLTPSANQEPTVRFFINIADSVYLISGTADRMTLETIAQSIQ